MKSKASLVGLGDAAKWGEGGGGMALPTVVVRVGILTVTTLLPACIIKYGSTLYIGMDEVLAHYACTFESSDLHFHFQ